MQFTMNLPPMESEADGHCPQEFAWFYSCSFNPSYACMQDPKHVMVKAYRNLMTKELQIGCEIASRSTLKGLLQQVGKSVSSLTESQVTQNKDRMSYEIASKVCNPRLTKLLKGPKEAATKGYLVMMRHIEIAYIEETTTPEQRIFSAWYAAFFIRIWKNLLVSSDRDNRSDAFNPTLMKNFISTNLATCIELNGHSILIFHNMCREMGQPELFLPSLLNSQHCESTFRSWRSLSSTRSTVVNMDIMEVTYRSTRLQVMEEAPTTISDFFANKTKKTNARLIPKTLLSNEEISSTVHDGFESAGKSLADLSEYCFLII